MISIVAVKRDFGKLFSVKQEIDVKFAVNRDFHIVFVIFDNRYYGSELFSLSTYPRTTTFTLLKIFSPLEMTRIKPGG